MVSVVEITYKSSYLSIQEGNKKLKNEKYWEQFKSRSKKSNQETIKLINEKVTKVATKKENERYVEPGSKIYTWKQ